MSGYAWAFMAAWINSSGSHSDDEDRLVQGPTGDPLHRRTQIPRNNNKFYNGCTNLG